MSTKSIDADLNVCDLFQFERKRLNLSQKEIADFLGMSSKQIGRWESLTPIPADKLSKLTELGFDSNYVVTGVRSRQLDVSALQDCIEILESALVQTGRQLTPAQKARVVGVLYDEYTDETTEFNVQSVVKHLRLVG